MRVNCIYPLGAYKKHKMETEREKAIEIIMEFEELLESHNIKIPSNDREGEEGEACIFGTDYYTLEDKITSIILKWKQKKNKN